MRGRHQGAFPGPGKAFCGARGRADKVDACGGVFGVLPQQCSQGGMHGEYADLRMEGREYKNGRAVV